MPANMFLCTLPLLVNETKKRQTLNKKNKTKKAKQNKKTKPSGANAVENADQTPKI